MRSQDGTSQCLGLSFATAAQQRGLLKDGPLSIVGNLERIPVAWNHLTGVVARLVPATPHVEAQSKYNRGGRDGPGHDRGERQVLQHDRNPL
jgi:hypothetical protein